MPESKREKLSSSSFCAPRHISIENRHARRWAAPAAVSRRVSNVDVRSTAAASISSQAGKSHQIGVVRNVWKVRRRRAATCKSILARLKNAWRRATSAGITIFAISIEQREAIFQAAIVLLAITPHVIAFRALFILTRRRARLAQ